ncbi:SMI1/KNR4 family protein [Psychrobacillus sp. INOP01]|uniref:SMI1/KNR4 family protein n=1 Tax=Psychrobacillus sp. INOP01 TaxID=2829187 RepID=UPI001BAD37CB|nr:SMI1/KNR4 family protein [Psychrobacillus sp. INOP01]QUG40139.1 SMI1/KNR4 family protein [Psychrobacillus sp. INOP01]
MELNFEFSFKPLVSQDIEAFENEYGINLPENYKRFLLLNNGGKPVKRRFKTADGTITSSVMLFLPLSKETDSNLESFYEKYCTNKIVPSNLIPIGVDPADSLICLTISEQDKVYFCDMDYFEEDNELKNDYVNLISENFTLFLNSLYEA